MTMLHNVTVVSTFEPCMNVHIQCKFMILFARNQQVQQYLFEFGLLQLCWFIIEGGMPHVASIVMIYKSSILHYYYDIFNYAMQTTLLFLTLLSLSLLSYITLQITLLIHVDYECLLLSNIGLLNFGVYIVIAKSHDHAIVSNFEPMYYYLN